MNLTLAEKHRFSLYITIHKNHLMKWTFFMTDIEIGFLPWLMNEVDKTMEYSMVGRAVLDSKFFYLKVISEIFQ